MILFSPTIKQESKGAFAFVRRRHYICTYYKINDVTLELLRKVFPKLRELFDRMTQLRESAF